MASGLLDSRVDAVVDMIQPVNRQNSHSRGLVSWWLALPGAMGGARFMDIMSPGSGGNHGVLTNMNPASDWVASNRPGGSGALLLNGSSSYIRIPDVSALDVPFTTSDDMTISLWIKISTFGGDDRLVDKGGGSTGANGWTLELNGTDQLQMRVNDVSSVQSSAGALTTGVWQLVTLTYTGATPSDIASFYVNGVAQGTGNIGFPQPNSHDITIGRKTDAAANFFDGLTDDIRIWSRALSAFEVSQLYNLSRQGYPGLLNRIKFNTLAEVAAAGGLGIPIAAYHYNHHLRSMR